MTSQWNTMELGWFGPCLPARDLSKSLEFYRALGFEQVGGQVDQGWVVVNHGPTELTLMGFLNCPLVAFRGADIPGLAGALAERGLAPYHLEGMDPSDRNAKRHAGIRAFDAAGWPDSHTKDAEGKAFDASTSGDFLLEDPAGHLLYFDTVPVEQQRYRAGAGYAAEGSPAPLASDQPELGSLDLCVGTGDAASACREFYAAFAWPPCNSSDAWARWSPIARGPSGLVLEKSSTTELVLKFRGARVHAIARRLASAGHNLERDLGTASTLRVCDPDGQVIVLEAGHAPV